MLIRFSAIALLSLLCACPSGDGRPTRPGTETDGGTAGDGGGGNDGGGGGTDGSIPGCTPTGAENTPAMCSDAVDNDCDGFFDCSDPDCSGVGDCPVCGRVDTPLGSPLALPDGVGGMDCVNTSDCPSGQTCFDIEGDRECRESYRSTLDFVGFGSATFDNVDDFVSICVTMEHSWIRDTEIRLEAPNGAFIRLSAFLGRDGGEIYLGEADDCDDDDAPEPGTGATYCWTPTATREPMLEYANNGGSLDSAPACNSLFGEDADMMPPGDYQASDSFNNLIGTPLNGEWTLSVTDLWGIDNGYIFDWSITFSAANVEDCSSPLI